MNRAWQLAIKKMPAGRALPSVLFFAAAVLPAWLVSGRNPDHGAHLQLLWGAICFYAAGTGVEALFPLSRDRAAGLLFPVHRIVLGQAGLALYLYARSALAAVLGIPGVSRWELILGCAAVLLLRARTWPRESAPGSTAGAGAIPLTSSVFVWMAWWASMFAFVALRSGDLHTPSSDPDIHALFAKLTAEGGLVPYSLAPYDDQRPGYPSAFAVLNGLWILLTGASPVTVVVSQPALQASLAVGLVFESAAALRHAVVPFTALLLIGLAHYVFVTPLSADWPFLEGTPRLAHTALALVPFSMTIRLVAGTAGSVPVLLASLTLTAFGLAWAFGTNPAHVVVQLPVAIASTVLAGALARGSTRDPPATRASWWWLVGLVAVPAVIVGSDAWVVERLRGGGEASPGAPAGLGVETWAWGAAALEGLRSATRSSLMGVFPPACMASGHCVRGLPEASRWLTAAIYVLSAAALIIAWLKRRVPARTDSEGTGRRPWEAGCISATAVLSLGLGVWLAFFLHDAVGELLRFSGSLAGVLLRNYSAAGLAILTVHLFLLVVACTCALVGEWVQEPVGRQLPASPWRRLVPDAPAALLLGALGAAVIGAHEPVRRALAHLERNTVLRQGSTSMGRIDPEDVAFLRNVESIVPADEKVLLPGVAVRMNVYETWNFASGAARALPLYTRTPFAFFHGFGGRELDAAAYQSHVCSRFDVGWLDEKRVRWLFVTDDVLRQSCLANWSEVRDLYYEEVLRSGDRALYRLRRRSGS